MKILILDIYYNDFLKSLYAAHPKLGFADYNEQNKAIMNQCFGTSDFYSRNLSQIGHQTKDIIINAEKLQKKWAFENNFKYHGRTFEKIPILNRIIKSKWEENILLEQVRLAKPDVIYCQSLTYPSPTILRDLKKHCKLMVGQIASPVQFNYEELSHFDLILTSFPHFVQEFQKIGIKSEYFKIGFETSILSKLKKSKEYYGVSFIGGFSKHHRKSLDTLEFLAQKIKDVHFWGYGWNRLDKSSPILPKYHGEAWGIDMYNILYNSKISINRHIATAGPYANNMRLFESTGVGTLLITDYKENLKELFEIDKEVVTYKTKEELVEKVKFYLANEDKRVEIARAGQNRTLRDHTYKDRMAELEAIFKKYLK